jgi:hypothetical protein
MEVAMVDESKRLSYRIDLADDGQFELVQTHQEAPDKVIGKHPTRDAARGWLVEHLASATVEALSRLRPPL